MGMLLVSAPVAMAGPVDGWVGGLAGWWADAWAGVTSVLGVSSESSTTEEEPEPVPLPLPPVPTAPVGGGTTSDCTDCSDDGEQGPTLDPDG